MDEKLMENINKIKLFSDKIEKLNNLLVEENYSESYKIISALIEVACMMLLINVYKEDVEDTNIVLLDKLMRKHNEMEIHELLIDINGEYNFINLNKISKLEITSLIGNLDDILKIILEKYGDIFE